MTDTLTASKAPHAVASLKHFLILLGHQLKAHTVLSLFCVASFIAAIIIKASLGQEMGVSAWSYLEPIITTIVPLTFGISLIFVLSHLFFIKRSKSPIHDVIKIYRSILEDPRRWAKAVPAIGIMLFGFMAFTELKPVIPALNPYSWDVAFMELDRLLHFGQDPWRLLQPLFGHAIPTLIINFFYNFWFTVMFAFWLASGTTAKDHGWERQFLLSFIMCWMIGGVGLAVVFSSMGPAFYDLVDPNNNPFADQMIWLSAINENTPVYALETQDMLRESYLNPAQGGIAGISAMPSMHNAVTTVFMLTAFRIHRILGWVMAGFLAIIVIGSVHLAWHYAVDSYAGIIMALGFWWLANKLIAWQDKLLKLT